MTHKKMQGNDYPLCKDDKNAKSMLKALDFLHVGEYKYTHPMNNKCSGGK